MDSLIQIGISGIWEAICVWVFGEAFLERKKKFASSWLFLGLYAVGSVTVVFLLRQHFVLKLAGAFLYYFLLECFFYEGSFFKKFLICLLYYLLSATIESVLVGTVTVLFPMAFLLPGHLWFNVFIVFLCKVVQFFICMGLYSRFHKKRELSFLSPAEWLLLCSYTIVITALLGAVSRALFTQENSQEMLLAVVVGIAFLSPVIFFLVFYVNRRENSIRQQQLQLQKEQSQMHLYETMRSDYERQSKIVHDYKNQLSYLQNMLAGADMSEAVRYIESLSGEIADKTQVVTCHHPVADVIINYKYHDAKRKDIAMILKVGDLSGIQVEEYDLVILISNLLDNAIEACEKVQGKRVIRLEADNENGEFNFKLTNSARADLVITDGRIESTKKDRQRHGIGLENVREIIEKYDGTCSIACEQGEFRFYFSI